MHLIPHGRDSRQRTNWILTFWRGININLQRAPSLNEANTFKWIRILVYSEKFKDIQTKWLKVAPTEQEENDSERPFNNWALWISEFFKFFCINTWITFVQLFIFDADDAAYPVIPEETNTMNTIFNLLRRQSFLLKPAHEKTLRCKVWKQDFHL